MSRLAKGVFVSAALLLPLLVLTTSRVAAQGEPQARRGLFGEVVAVTGDTIAVETRAGERVNLVLDSGTEVTFPGRPGFSRANLPGLLLRRVAVLVEERDGELYAVKVLVKPRRPVIRHFVGAVVEVRIQDSTVVLEDKEGRQFTVALPQGFAVVPGQLLIVTASREVAPLSGIFQGMDLERADKIVQRLEKHLKKPGAEMEETGPLRQLIQENVGRHLLVLAQVRSRLKEQQPEQSLVLTALARALERASKDYERILGAIGAPSRPVAKIEGEVRTVDPVTNTITIGSLTLKVDERTRIEIEGKEEAALADVLPGQRAEVWFDPQGLLATKIEVKGEAEMPGRLPVHQVQFVEQKESDIRVSPEEGVMVRVEGIVEQGHLMVRKIQALGESEAVILRRVRPPRGGGLGAGPGPSHRGRHCSPLCKSLGQTPGD